MPSLLDIEVKYKSGTTVGSGLSTNLAVPALALAGDTLVVAYTTGSSFDGAGFSVTTGTGWTNISTATTGSNAGIAFKRFRDEDPPASLTMNFGAALAQWSVTLFVLSGVSRSTSIIRVYQQFTPLRSSSGNTSTTTLTSLPSFPAGVLSFYGRGIEFLIAGMGTQTTASGWSHNIYQATIDSIVTANTFETLKAGDYVASSVADPCGPSDISFGYHLAWRDVVGKTDTIGDWVGTCTCTAKSRFNCSSVVTTQGFMDIIYSVVLLWQDALLVTPRFYTGFGGGTTMEGCRAIDNGGDGIFFSRKGGIIKSCEATGNGGNGFYLGGARGVVINGCDSYGNGGDGLNLEGAQSCIANGNRIADGVRLPEGATAVMVQRNMARAGITVEADAEDCFVTANDLKGSSLTDNGTDTETARGNLTT